MNKTLSFLLVAAGLFSGSVFNCRAQFYSDGCDPASVRWSYVDSDHYRLIYPRGMDSLARVYAYHLESVWSPVGGSLGYLPTQYYKKKFPVVLRTHTADANGSVVWTPSRCQLYTVPDAYSTDPIERELSLTLHESRHIAQMQIGGEPFFRWMKYPVGELGTGALAGVFGGQSFFEGDAVLAETSLTPAGRGRSADFLEYWRAVISSGQRRSYWSWRWGSQRNFTPTYYTTGYVLQAGMSALYEPDFTRYYYDRIRRKHGWAWFNLQNSVKEVSGMKFRKAFASICDTLAAEWHRDSLERGPHMPSTQITADPVRYTDIHGTVALGGKLFSIVSGIADVTWLTQTGTDGQQKRISIFSNVTSSLRASEATGELYWSERRADSRWTLKSTSVIMARSPEGKERTVRTGGRLYNPYPSPDGLQLAVVDYPEDGGSAIAILDSRTGATAKYFKAPKEIQAVEPVWLENGIWFYGVTAEGSGIYSLDGFKRVMDGGHSRIKDLHSRNGLILFTSDRNGVDELYSMDTDGSVRQLTSLGNGAESFAFVGDSLYYSVLKPEGRVICRTATDELPIRQVMDPDSHRWPFVNEIAAAEPEPIVPVKDTVVSEVHSYGKIAHLFRIHSWAPVFIDYDAVSSLSFDNIFSRVNVGATAFFQNTLGTADGYVGASLFNSQFNFRPSLHGRFTFSGLYPVITVSGDFNGSNANIYTIKKEAVEEGTKITLLRQTSDKPLISGEIKTYIPFKFNSGGLSRGVIPTLTYDISNTTVDGKPYSRLSGSVRGYIVSQTPSSCVYPKWGVGIEVGTSLRPTITEVFCPNIYLSGYAYLPGFWKTHGIRIAAVSDFLVKRGYFTEPYALTAPRGCAASSLTATLGSFNSQSRFSFDYAMPFAPVDWDFLCPVAYIRNFELKPFIDWSLYVSKTAARYNLFSAGTSLDAVLGNLAWLPFTTRIGVTLAWNGGDMIDYLSSSKITINPFYAGLLFTIDI